jgi:hypothetical protein
MLLMPGGLQAENPFDLIGRKWFDASQSWAIASQASQDLGTVIPPDQWEQRSPKKLPAGLPVMTMFVTDGCGWCNVGKSELAARSESLPVQIKLIHTNSGNVPGWVESYPTFYWKAADGKYRKRVGWPGADALLDSWKLTQQPVAQTGYRGSSQTQWTFPGSTRSDLIEHLQSGEHRGKFTASQLDRMTFQQLQQLHSDDHVGQVVWDQLPVYPY